MGRLTRVSVHSNVLLPLIILCLLVLGCGHIDMYVVREVFQASVLYLPGMTIPTGAYSMYASSLPGIIILASFFAECEYTAVHSRAAQNLSNRRRRRTDVPKRNKESKPHRQRATTIISGWGGMMGGRTDDMILYYWYYFIVVGGRFVGLVRDY